MKLIIKNYTIEQEENCVRLSETKIIEKGEKKGEEYEASVIYPLNTLTALKRVRTSLTKKDIKEYSLDEYMEKLEQIDKDFLDDLTNILGEK